MTEHTDKSILSELKLSLARISLEKQRIQEDIKQAKALAKLTAQTNKNSKGPRTTNPTTRSKKTKEAKAIPDLTFEEQTHIASIDWTAECIIEWINHNFTDDPPTDPWPEKLAEKVRKHYDNPKAGFRTINTALKPTITKWAAYATVISDESSRSFTLHKIAHLSAIVDKRRLQLMPTRDFSPPSSPTTPSSLPGKIKMLTNGSMCLLDTSSQDNTDHDLTIECGTDYGKDAEDDDLSSLQSGLCSLSITSPLGDIDQTISTTDHTYTIIPEPPSCSTQIKEDNSTISLRPMHHTFESDSMIMEDMRSNKVDTDFKLTLILPSLFPPTSPSIIEESVDGSQSDNSETDSIADDQSEDITTKTFSELFKGRETDCLTMDGFTSRNSKRGKITMIFISYNNQPMASYNPSNKRWVYGDNAEIPLAMISK